MTSEHDSQEASIAADMARQLNERAKRLVEQRRAKQLPFESLGPAAVDEANDFANEWYARLPGFDASKPAPKATFVRKRLVTEKHPTIVEADGSPVECASQQVFQNWGRTVENTPQMTLFPVSKVGVCNAVLWARENNKTVRVCGYRHSWSELFSGDGQLLISVRTRRDTYLPAEHHPIDPNNEFESIEFLGEASHGGKTVGLVKIGAGTTNEQIRRWCRDPQGGNFRWTLPLNVILVENSIAGTVTPMCHGAGLQHPTMADLVAEMEFVNARGVLQTIQDPDMIRAVAGHLGLLGVVTSFTIRFDPMSYARQFPVERKLILTVPPVDGEDIPPEIDANVTPEQIEAARADFALRAETHYYAQWFWFPYQANGLIHTWKNDGLCEESVEYPSEAEAEAQALQQTLAQTLNETIYSVPGTGKNQALVFGEAAHQAIRKGEEFTTTVIDALHFRRGIHNMRVRDLEWELPVPSTPDGKPDWSLCQRAWWIVLQEFYEADRSNRNPDKKSPMRIALEMRVMGGSDAVLAPQRGNVFGTCAIEVLTTPQTPEDVWREFKQKVTDRWVALAESTGAATPARMHWCKEWVDVQVKGVTAAEYAATVYADCVPEFEAQLQRVAQAGGYEVSDMLSLFSNAFTREVFPALYDER